MTLPANLDFSLLNIDTPVLDSENIITHSRDIAEQTQNAYQDIAINFNGFNKTSFLDNDGTLNRLENWTPTLKGTSTAGTFTYTSQNGWAFRQGLLVDIWFDIIWTGSGTAAGNLYVELPYKVARIDGKPFTGTIQSSSITYATGTYMVCNSIPNTYRCEIWTAGSGATTANRTVVSSGQLIGSIRYMGILNE